MTGYGRGECSQDGYKVTAELSSVNRKQTEITVYLPRELEPLESRVRNEINRRIGRGRLTARIALHTGEEALSVRAHINEKVARAYARELTKLAKDLNLSGQVSLDHLVRAPGVFRSDFDTSDSESFWPAVEKALKIGLDALLSKREKEGIHLKGDILKRVETMRKGVTKLQREAPRMIKRYQKALIERITAAGLTGITPDDERLAKEIVYFADRSDITEELTRLESHFNQFDDLARSKEPVGRTLDFLAQEINREINTVGSKASDGVIVRQVVNLKAELEKFREQVQNVE
jgi:uncharacterized protein (TIGR00255 family)